MAASANEFMIIGVGNEWRGDDAAGLWIARRLKEKMPAYLAHIAIEECTGDQTRLLDLWRGVDRLILIDVVQSGGAPGTLHRIDQENHRLLRQPLLSSHGTGVAEVLELGRALNRLPVRWRIYAIEGREFALGAPISPAVMRGAEEAVAAIRDELNDLEEEHRA